MLRTRLGKEVVITMPNEIGALAKLVKIVADKGINIVAVSSWVTGSTATVRLVTEDNLRVVDALNERGVRTWEAEVVIAELEHRPGMLRRITEKLAQHDIDLHHLYVTAGNQDNCIVVFGSAHNERAAVLLQDLR